MTDVRDRLAEYRAGCEGALARWWSGAAGCDLAAELAGLDARFEDLATGDLVEAARAEFETAPGDEARESRRRVLHALEEVAIGAELRGLLTERASREAGARVRVGRRELGAFAARLRADSQTDDAARDELARGLDAVDADLAPLREECRAAIAVAWAGRGHATPLERARVARPGVDLESWVRGARIFLDRTETTWRDLLRRALAAADLAPEAPRAIDYSRALALPRWWRWLRGVRSSDVLDGLLGSWGASELAGTRFETAGPAGHPAPRLFRIRVPGDLRAVAPARGPVRDLLARLDLAGRALADGFVSEALPFERRVLGDPALGHAWGALLRDRVFDPAWADAGPVAARAATWCEDARVLRLGPLRRLAARVIGELELAALDPDVPARSLADDHAARMSDALGVDWSGHALLRDLDALPRSVDALRGACLATQLAEHLRTAYGRAFWTSRRCGELLKEVWNTGSTYDAHELASQLDLGPLDAESLLAEPT